MQYRDFELKEATKHWEEKDYYEGWNADDNVIFWNSNKRAVPHDLMLKWLALGFVSEQQVTDTRAKEQKQIAEFMVEYHKARAERTPEQIAEEEFEIKDELDKVTEQGFTTIKIKVGKDVNADIK